MSFTVAELTRTINIGARKYFKSIRNKMNESLEKTPVTIIYKADTVHQ